MDTASNKDTSTSFAWTKSLVTLRESQPLWKRIPNKTVDHEYKRFRFGHYYFSPPERKGGGGVTFSSSRPSDRPPSLSPSPGSPYVANTRASKPRYKKKSGKDLVEGSDWSRTRIMPERKERWVCEWSLGFRVTSRLLSKTVLSICFLSLSLSPSAKFPCMLLSRSFLDAPRKYTYVTSGLWELCVTTWITLAPYRRSRSRTLVSFVTRTH